MLSVRRSAVVLTVSLVLVLGVMVSAWARFVPKVSAVSGSNNSGIVMVNGRKAMRLLKPNGDLSAAARTKVVADRLVSLVNRGLDGDAISVEIVGRNARVMVGKEVLAIATVDEAHAQGLSTSDLACLWARNLKQLLALPPLSVNPSTVVVPLGESRTVSVESLLSDPIEAEVAKQNIINVDGQGKPGSLVVTGLNVGEASITVKCSECRCPVRVMVKKYAASAGSGTQRAVVTGWNPPQSLIAAAVEDAVRRGVKLERGAKIRSIDTSSFPGEVNPGNVVQAQVKVSAGGEDYLTAQFPVKVEIENRRLTPSEPAELFYSNDPERLEKYQVLYTGRVSAQKGTARLLYHHQNMMDRRVGFVVDIINPSTTDASLHIVEGVSSPMLDTVLVGYKAGMEFLRNHRSGTGRIVSVPAGSRLCIVSQPLESQRTASGIIEFRELSGDPLYVRVTAKPEDTRAAEDFADGLRTVTEMEAAMFNLSDHVYPDPMLNLDATYTAGKPWVFIRLGKDPLKHASQNKQLFGNYGVTYNINVKIDNPLETPQTVELAFEATAGPASGVFYIDGDFVPVRFLLSPSEATLKRVIVPAGQKRDLTVVTMPLSGSAYPATLIIRPSGTTASMVSRN